MLHELLLSLTGHPSPLLTLDTPDTTTSALTSLASPSELSLLRSISALGGLQNEVRTLCVSLTSPNFASQTIIAPAIASAALDGPLAAFQSHVGSVERRIISQDATLVGAYRSVPLAAVVAEFDGWERILTWLRDTLRSAQKGGDRKQGRQTGAQLLDSLRRESRTGYPDIARVCDRLLRAGEAAWVRQLAAWVLYGRLPDVGKQDFFIQQASSTESPGHAEFVVERDLLPGFVTPSAAASILFIGRSLHHVQAHLAKEPDARMQMDINALVQRHLGQLSSLEIPIVPSALATMATAVRISLAQNALQKLLPMSTIRHVLNVLREFFLLERGEFAMALIGVTDAHLAERSTSSGKNDGRLLGGAMIKEAELSAIMSKTWSSLAALQPVLPDAVDDYEDDALDTARDTIELAIRKSHAKKGETRLASTATAFDDLLVGVPTVLTMAVASPLDMFLSAADVRTYAQIHAYLLALRRSHLHLTNLSHLSVLRRIHPAPHPVNSQNHTYLASSRSHAASRARRLRATWAAISAATLLLSELSTYLQGEVVAASGAAFRDWVAPASSAAEPPAPPDPATLAHAHRRYLAALVRSLLLTDAPFTRVVRTLLVRSEHVASLVRRLAVVVRSVTESESIGADGSDHFVREEQTLDAHLREGRDALRASITDVVQRVRALEIEHLNQAVVDEVRLDAAESRDDYVRDLAGEREFTPWKGPGLGRLLMRLEVGNLDGRRRDEVDTLLPG